MSVPLAARFWAKVDRRGRRECWPWKGAVSKGYGNFRVGGRDGRMQGAHRVAYELCIGPVPPGMQLDHLCENSRCVNPTHLEVVTSRENTLRGRSFAAMRALQVRCKRGHLLDGDNVYRAPGYPNRRACRACWNWKERAAKKERTAK
jgi:hypothetical protein